MSESTAVLAILPLGAIGVQDFRSKTIGASIEAGQAATQSASAGSRSAPS